MHGSHGFLRAGEGGFAWSERGAQHNDNSAADALARACSLGATRGETHDRRRTKCSLLTRFQIGSCAIRRL